MNISLFAIVCCLLYNVVWAQDPTVTVTWDPELGKLTEITLRRDGSRHGTQLWLQNGYVLRKEVWANDRLVGPVEQYWLNGSIKARYGVDAEGRLHGRYERYYPNRKLQEVTHYAHGTLLPGTIRTNYPNGRPAAIRCYRACTPEPGAADTTGAPMPVVGTPPGPGLVADSTWHLYNFRGQLHRSRTYACGRVVEDRLVAEFADTLVGGTNPMLAEYNLKNIIVGTDSLGYPMVVRKKGRYIQTEDISAWGNRRVWVNKQMVESYFISRTRNVEATKTYYESERTRSSVIHRLGARTRSGSTFYPGTQLKQTWTEDLRGNRIGLYTHYWANGKVYEQGYYVQDSTQTLETLTLKGRKGKQEDEYVPIHPSHKHGTWRRYDFDGGLIREEEWEMGNPVQR
jgi:antitoxin component YwqK of YwqJK toxin-antitoxin module